MPTTVPFDELADSDLVVDCVYKGGIERDARAEVISRLLPGTGVAGGFRPVGRLTDGTLRFCIIYSNLSEPAWPDALDVETGQFVYWGDNRHPGHRLGAKKGNRVLEHVFDGLHSGERGTIPPFFVFTKAGTGYDVKFRGLAVPGALGISPAQDLVAVWKASGVDRFQNYRAIMTILDAPVVTRAWIDDLRAGNAVTQNAPDAWKQWVDGGAYRPLRAEPTVAHRTPAEQLPTDPTDVQMLARIVSYFEGHPDGKYAFEPCAVEIAKLMDEHFVEFDLTRPWRDGGRDAAGKYVIGTEKTRISVECALEAKCKTPSTNNSSGVHDTARLIARLRHRQFGLFVTTSCVALQAYKEIVEDRHPVIVVAGVDVVDILKRAGIDTPEKVGDWLAASF